MSEDFYSPRPPEAEPLLDVGMEVMEGLELISAIGSIAVINHGYIEEAAEPRPTQKRDYLTEHEIQQSAISTNRNQRSSEAYSAVLDPYAVNYQQGYRDNVTLSQGERDAFDGIVASYDDVVLGAWEREAFNDIVANYDSGEGGGGGEGLAGDGE